jgi:hypothetical protein
VLARHGGTLAKFIGDAVMAVYGIPRLHEDDALQAVRGAAELGDALAELNGELEAAWGVRLALRTGVNTGEVVVGDAVHGQEIVVGDAVNVAARLEQAVLLLATAHHRHGGPHDGHDPCPAPDALHEPPQHAPAVVGDRRISSGDFGDIEAEPEQNDHDGDADKEGRPGVPSDRFAEAWVGGQQEAVQQERYEGIPVPPPGLLRAESGFNDGRGQGEQEDRPGLVPEGSQPLQSCRPLPRRFNLRPRWSWKKSR